MLSWLNSMLRPTKTHKRPVGHPPPPHKIPNGLANRVEAEQRREGKKKKRKKMVMKTNTVWIAAERAW